MRSTIEEQVLAPIGNTAQIAQTTEDNPVFTVRVDWLRVIVPTRKMKTVNKRIAWLMKWFKDEFTWSDVPVREGKWWDNYGRSVCGIVAYYNMPNDERGTQGEMMIDIPARAIARLEQQIFFWICERLYHDCQARATRVDVALDTDKDHQFIRKDDVYQAYRLGNFKRFQKANFVESKKAGKDLGWTAYFGSRQSDVMFRIYDKDAETKGKIKSIRLEAEYHNDLAESVFKHIATIFSKLHHLRDGHVYVASALSQLFFDEKYGLSFINRREEEWEDLKPAYRCDECIWWERLRKFVTGFFSKADPDGQYKPVLAKKKVVPTLAKSLDWLKSKVGNTFTAAIEVYGEELVMALMKKMPEVLPVHIKKKMAVARIEIETGMLA